MAATERPLSGAVFDGLRHRVVYGSVPDYRIPVASPLNGYRLRDDRFAGVLDGLEAEHRATDENPYDFRVVES